MEPDAAPRPEDLGFAGCVGELSRIVAGLEGDEVDVDHLSARVERATELIAWCRDRLDGARLSVEEVLERLESAGAADVAPDDPDAGAEGVGADGG